MKITFPGINGKRFSHEFIKRQAVRRIRPFLNAIGEARIKLLIERGDDLAQHVPPQQLEAYKVGAQNMSLMGMTGGDLTRVLTDDDIFEACPEWAQRLVIENGDRGVAWFNRQVAWIRKEIFQQVDL